MKSAEKAGGSALLMFLFSSYSFDSYFENNRLWMAVNGLCLLGLSAWAVYICANMTKVRDHLLNHGAFNLDELEK